MSSARSAGRTTQHSGPARTGATGSSTPPSSRRSNPRGLGAALRARQYSARNHSRSRVVAGPRVSNRRRSFTARRCVNHGRRTSASRSIKYSLGRGPAGNWISRLLRFASECESPASCSFAKQRASARNRGTRCVPWARERSHSNHVRASGISSVTSHASRSQPATRRSPAATGGAVGMPNRCNSAPMRKERTALERRNNRLKLCQGFAR